MHFYRVQSGLSPIQAFPLSADLILGFNDEITQTNKKVDFLSKNIPFFPADYVVYEQIRFWLIECRGITCEYNTHICRAKLGCMPTRSVF